MKQVGEQSNGKSLVKSFRICLEKSYASGVRGSRSVQAVANMFGLGVDESREVSVVGKCELVLRGGDLVFVTGPSGGGKSTILDLISDYAEGEVGLEVLKLGEMRGWGDEPLVDCFGEGLSLKEVMSVLSAAGLADAFVMLRSYGELSEGQRFRFQLALVMGQILRLSSDQKIIVIADEFCSLLDRQTAGGVARNFRRLMNRLGHDQLIFVCASAHDDLLEHLGPSVLIDKGLGDALEIVYLDQRLEK